MWRAEQSRAEKLTEEKQTCKTFAVFSWTLSYSPSVLLLHSLASPSGEAAVLHSRQLPLKERGCGAVKGCGEAVENRCKNSEKMSKQ